MSNRELDLYPAESSLPVVLWVVPLASVVVMPGLFWTVAERPLAMHYGLAIWATVGVCIFAIVLLGILSRGIKRRLTDLDGLPARTMWAPPGRCTDVVTLDANSSSAANEIAR